MDLRSLGLVWRIIRRNLAAYDRVRSGVDGETPRQEGTLSHARSARLAHYCNREIRCWYGLDSFVKVKGLFELNPLRRFDLSYNDGFRWV